MIRTGIGAVSLLSLLLASTLAAQPIREFRGQVFHLGENGERIAEPGLIVTLVETGATDDANDQGIFRLPLPPAFQPGDTVTISMDKPGWRIRYPLDGGTMIPRDLLREIVPVELLQAGSKLFWTHDRIEKFIRDASERSKQEKRRGDEAPSLDLGRDIKEWAAKYGFSAQEARDEIDHWIVDVEAAYEDNYKKGLAAFAKRQFDSAAERFQDSAEWRIRQLGAAWKQQEVLAERTKRLREEVVRDLRMEGDSHYYASRFQQALEIYKQAHQYTSKDQTPDLWGVTLDDIGNAHTRLGIHVSTVERHAHFAAAVQAYQQAFLVYTREQTPQGWARTQINLGHAFAHWGGYMKGAEGIQLLTQAVQAYQQALLVYTRDQTPQEWAMAQSLIGTALLIQGESRVDAEGNQFLEQANQALRQAQLVDTRDQSSQEWAASQIGLAMVLEKQASRTPGAEGNQLLAQAVQAYQQALLFMNREQSPPEWPEQSPQLWARTQNRLGVALYKLGESMSGEEGVQFVAQAVDAFRQGLLVSTPDQDFRWWVSTCLNEAEALFALHRHEESAEALSQVLAKELDAKNHIVALGYAIAVGLVMNSPEVSDRAEELLGLAAQPQNFSIITWRFEETLHMLAEDAEIPQKELLIRLFEALKARDRESLIQVLKDVKAATPPGDRRTG